MKTITGVTVSDVEKRRHPSKHYVYVIFVRWSDDSQYVIYRRYSRFFDLQNTLLDKFPIEAGTLEPTQRILPILPGKILFGRSHIREVAMKRLQPIDEYCKSLISMPEVISQCDEVLEFFEVEDDDLDPPISEERKNPKLKVNKISKPKQLKQYLAVCDYVKQDRGEIDLHAGTVVELVEQSESGWWFVSGEDEQGWVPSTYLQPLEGTKEDTTQRAKPGEEEKYVCIDEFISDGIDELSLEKGAVVKVIEKNMEGWWLVRHRGKEGWAPATYLCKIKEKIAVCSSEKGHEGGVEIIGTLSDVSELLKQADRPTTDESQEQTIGTEEDIYSKVNKVKSLERGGSLRPPPRQNSFEPKTEVPPVKTLSSYVTIGDFHDAVGDGVSFTAGEAVIVHEKAAGGWWFVEIGDKEGWAPSSYIKSKPTECDGREPNPEVGALQSKKSNSGVTSTEWTRPSSYSHGKVVKDKLDQKENSYDFSCVFKPKLPPTKQTEPKPSSLPSKQIKSINSKDEVLKADQTDTVRCKITSGKEKTTSDEKKLSASSRSSLPSKPVLPSKIRGMSSQFGGKGEVESGVVVTKLSPVLLPREETANQACHKPEATLALKPAPPAKFPLKIRKSDTAPFPRTPTNQPPFTASDGNENQDNSHSGAPNVQGMIAALKSRFEGGGSNRNVPKPKVYPEFQPKSTEGIAQSLTSKFDNMNTVSVPKPQLPVRKTLCDFKESAYEGLKCSQQKQADELTNIRASGNISRVISSLDSQLKFGERSQRQFLTPADDKNFPSVQHCSIIPGGIFPVPRKNDMTANSQSSDNKYIATEEFTGNGKDEAIIKNGDILEVLDKSDDSWWLVRKGDGQEGYVPASYLEQS